MLDNIARYVPVTSDNTLFCSPELVHSWQNGHCSVPYIPRMVDLSMPKVLKFKSILDHFQMKSGKSNLNLKPKTHESWYPHQVKEASIFICLQFFNPMACLVWKPVQFEVQSYGGVQHTAPIEFVKKYTLSGISYWFLAFLGVSVKKSACVNVCCFSSDNHSPWC